MLTKQSEIAPKKKEQPDWPTADASKTNTMTIPIKLKRQPKAPNAYKTNQNDLAGIARTQPKATSCLQNKRNGSSNRWPARPPHRELIRKQSKAALPRLRRRHPKPPNAYKAKEKTGRGPGRAGSGRVSFSSFAQTRGLAGFRIFLVRVWLGQVLEVKVRR